MKFEGNKFYDRVAWEKIKKLEICHGINSIEDYNFQVATNTARAHKTLVDAPIVNPTLRQIQVLHYELFKNVHPWAGEIRLPGNLVTMGGLIACEPQRIKIELDMLHLQTVELLGKAETPEQKIALAAFHHRRYELIHPFADGNGRTGRLWVHSQLAGLLGRRERSLLLRDLNKLDAEQDDAYSEYHTALRRCANDHLAPLVKLFMEHEGLDASHLEKIMPPFRIPPFRIEGETQSLPEEVERSRK